jgi:hypothetical protein
MPERRDGQTLAITHIFSRWNNALLALLKVVFLCAEPFEGLHVG